MTRTRSIALLARRLVLAALALAATGPALAADVRRPVLLELFTSQGCSSCPPADRLLAELATRGDVLALAFHVDYWDGLGWADRHGSPAWTRRQQAYAQRSGSNVYTPQLVIDGRAELVGSRRDAVIAGIARAKQRARGAPASIARDGATLSLSIGVVADVPAVRGQVLLASFDRQRSTRISAGENSGEELVEPAIVRSLRGLGEWRNAPLQLGERLRGDEVGERLALIVQGDDGTVWALASTP